MPNNGIFIHSYLFMKAVSKLAICMTSPTPAIILPPVPVSPNPLTQSKQVRNFHSAKHVKYVTVPGSVACVLQNSRGHSTNDVPQQSARRMVYCPGEK